MNIQIRLRDDKHNVGWGDAVEGFFEDLPPNKYNFKDCIFRVNGKVFTSNTQAFRAEVERAKIWRILSDNV